MWMIMPGLATDSQEPRHHSPTSPAAAAGRLRRPRAAPGQRHADQDQGDTGEHGRGNGLVEDHDAEHDRDHWQWVGHRGGDGRSSLAMIW